MLVEAMIYYFLTIKMFYIWFTEQRKGNFIKNNRSADDAKMTPYVLQRHLVKIFIMQTVSLSVSNTHCTH